MQKSNELIVRLSNKRHVVSAEQHVVDIYLIAENRNCKRKPMSVVIGETLEYAKREIWRACHTVSDGAQVIIDRILGRVTLS